MRNDAIVLTVAALCLAIWVYLFLKWNPWASPSERTTSSSTGTPADKGPIRTPDLLDPADIWVLVDDVDKDAGPSAPRKYNSPFGSGSRTGPSNRVRARGTSETEDRLVLSVGGPRDQGRPSAAESVYPGGTEEIVVLHEVPGDEHAADVADASQGGSGPKRFHVIKKGDTLSDLASRYLGSSRRWKKILEANKGIRPECLPVGAKLVIPQEENAQEKREVVAHGKSRGGAQGHDMAARESIGVESKLRTYVIARGDNLYRISKRFYGKSSKWRRIYRANRKALRNPNIIEPGIKIIIP